MSQVPTATEAFLAALARRAFLRLWSYPNLYKSPGKELCDLLVLFGSDLVIFSDKNCEMPNSGDIERGWRRWYKRAVLESAAQISGAERWLSRCPQQMFEDASCRQRLTLSIPPNAAVHRILTVRGAADAAHAEWGGRGTLMVTNRPLADCSELPLHLGAIDNSGRFFHVFDEVALEVTLTTLDTIVDFLSYLRERETFLRRPHSVLAASEEDLLALYLMSFDESRNELAFPRFTEDSVVVDGQHWDHWLTSPQRAARDNANRVSYAWDSLVEKFSFHTITGTQDFATSRVISEQEPLLRWFGGQSRLQRRVLATTLFDMLATTPRGQLRRRASPPFRPGDPYWVLLAFPHPEALTYEEYREARRMMLQSAAYVIRHLNPDALDIVALAVGESDGCMTEDALWLDCREWPADLDEIARLLHSENGIFANATTLHQSHSEYPI